MTTITDLGIFRHNPRCTRIISTAPVGRAIGAPHRRYHGIAIARHQPIRSRGHVAKSILNTITNNIVKRRFNNNHNGSITAIIKTLNNKCTNGRVRNSLRRDSACAAARRHYGAICSGSRGVLNCSIACGVNSRRNGVHVSHSPNARVPLSDGKRLVLGGGMWRNYALRFNPSFTRTRKLFLQLVSPIQTVGTGSFQRSTLIFPTVRLHIH